MSHRMRNIKPSIYLGDVIRGDGGRRESRTTPLNHNKQTRLYTLRQREARRRLARRAGSGRIRTGYSPKSKEEGRKAGDATRRETRPVPIWRPNAHTDHPSRSAGRAEADACSSGRAMYSVSYRQGQMQARETDGIARAFGRDESRSR